MDAQMCAPNVFAEDLGEGLNSVAGTKADP